MGTDLATPTSFEDVVKDKVRKVLLDSIPDAQIEELLQKEFKRFFEGHTSGYNNQTKHSSLFSQMVQKEIEAFFQTRIKEYVNKACEKSELDGNYEKVTGDIVAKIAPAVMESVVQGIVGTAISHLQNSLQRGY